jgi:hypothetical protein
MTYIWASTPKYHYKHAYYLPSQKKAHNFFQKLNNVKPKFVEKY